MADQTLNEIADARFLEVARLRTRVERAEGAVGRLLEVCKRADVAGVLLSPDEVRAAIGGAA